MNTSREPSLAGPVVKVLFMSLESEFALFAFSLSLEPFRDANCFNSVIIELQLDSVASH